MTDEHTHTRPSGDRPYAVPSEVAILPLRDTVLFPNSFMPLAVARESSVTLVDEAIASAKVIGVFTQKDPSLEDPSESDLQAVGTLTHIHKMFKLPDGSLRLIVQGVTRLKLERIVATRPYLRAEVVEVADIPAEPSIEVDALERNIRTNFAEVVELSPVLSDDLAALASNITDVARLTDFIASSLHTINIDDAAGTAGDAPTSGLRMDALNRILTKELEVLELGSKIQSQVQSEVGKGQREYFLREQIKAIQKELGEGDDQAKEIDELREKIDAAGMPDEVKKEAVRELDRLVQDPGSRGRVHRRARPTSTGSSPCRGPSERMRSSTSARRNRCSTPSTPASRSSRTASSSTSRSAS